MYADTLQAPFPAIRFKEETAEVAKIRQKEQGDWKKMTVEEKKALYRHSFCQTIAEYKEPTSDWKKIVGIALVFISFGIWGVVWLKLYGKSGDTRSVMYHLKKQMFLLSLMSSTTLRKRALKVAVP